MNEIKQINLFLQQTSESQRIFIWNGDDYIFQKGTLAGYSIKELMNEYKDELKQYFIELYENESSNYHTKEILRDIKKLHY